MELNLLNGKGWPASDLFDKTARRPPSLHLCLFSDFLGVVDLDAEVADCALKLGMTEQELDSTQVLRLSVNQSRLGSAHGMGAVRSRIQSDRLGPRFDNSGVLPGRQVRRLRDSAWEQELGRTQVCLLDPNSDRRSRLLRDFELNGPLGLLRHDDCPR